MEKLWDPLYPLIQEPVIRVYPILALTLFFGLLLGYLAKELKFPSLSGNILAGLLLGPIFGIVNTSMPKASMQLEPVTDMAFSLIAISIGSHLKFTCLHNSFKRILVITFVQVLLVPCTVFLGVYLVVRSPAYVSYSHIKIAAFLAIFSIATAPATVVHMIKESQAKGIFVKTLIAVVVLNNVANIVCFEFLKDCFFEGSKELFYWVVGRLVFSLILGVGVSIVLMFLRRKIFSRQAEVTFSFAALLISHGLALQLSLSPVLTNLTLGIVLANFSDRNQILDIFEDFEEIIYALFFTLTGTHASLMQWSKVGILFCVYVLCRLLGNLLCIYASGRLTHLPKRVYKYLGLSLMPQGGITVGLIVSLNSISDADKVVAYLTPVILMAVTFTEIMGPLILRISLKRSGEEGQALPRLIDFIQEEYILIDPSTGNKQTALIELVDFLFKTHHLEHEYKIPFLQSVLKREQQGVTILGKGIALPHGFFEGCHKVMGVMGIFRQGMDWGGGQKNTVHIVILLASPSNKQDLHLKVLGSISKLFSKITHKNNSLHLANNAAEVYEAIADEEFESLNKLLVEV